MGKRNSWVAAVVGAIGLLTAPCAQAAVVEGTVTDAGKRPIPGALVSVRDEARGYYETVYSDANGRFRLTTLQQGELLLRARKLSFADASRPLRLESASSIAVDFTLTPLTDPEDIADNLPSSAHFAKIPFDATGPNSRAAIQMTCTNCHSLGSAFNRIPRLPEEWAPVVARMLTENVGVPPANLDALTESRANKLAAGFTDDLPQHKQTQLVSPELSAARVTEWAIPGDSPLPYGIAVSSRDGRLYVADSGEPRLLVIDPKGKEVKELPLASQAFRARGIAEGQDGKMYFTAPVLGLIGAFDLTSTDIVWTLVGARSPGTIRVGKDGMVWWTHNWDDRADDRPGVGWVGRLDPRTGEATLIELPLNGPQEYVVPSFQPFTLGIDVDPVNGDVWYSKLYANKIGRIDPSTLAAVEFTPPQMGPRGLRFDKNGTLWVAFSGSSSIAALDPKTMKWELYPLPTLSPQETDAPYTLAIHPANQDVWVTANQSDLVYRFIPGERRFITYPLPTRDTWMRDIAFTQDGLVCGTSGPLPPINTEGGYPLVICIDPGGRNR